MLLVLTKEHKILQELVNKIRRHFQNCFQSKLRHHFLHRRLASTLRQLFDRQSAFLRYPLPPQCDLLGEKSLYCQIYNLLFII